MGNFIISIIKLLGAVLLLPFTIAASKGLYHHLIVYSPSQRQMFIDGGIVFIFIYLFAYQFVAVYEFGKKAVESSLKIIAPLDRIGSRLFSLYLIIVVIAFFIINNLMKVGNTESFFMFALGFCLVMHVVLSALDMQNGENTIIKPDYLFLINGVIIVNVFLLILALGFILDKAEFIKFFKITLNEAFKIYRACFGRIY